MGHKHEPLTFFVPSDTPAIQFSDPTPGAAAAAGGSGRHFPPEHKQELHKLIVDRLDLGQLANITVKNDDSMRTQIRRIVRDGISELRLPYSGLEREELVEQLLDEVGGCGPIQPLLEDPTVTEIMVNTFDSVYVERKGLIEKTNIAFSSDQHLQTIIERIVSAVGRRVDESSPMVDARLQDGSRVNAVIPPCAIDGPHLTIRKFSRRPFTDEELIDNKTLTRNILEFLKSAVAAKFNILISGGTGAGKTSLLNTLSRSIGPRERVVTIEDAAELQLQQEHVVRLETKVASIEGKGAISQDALLVNSLRMRPDRIILGEVRDIEAMTLLKAMTTGHEGSLSSIHATTPREALWRLEGLAMNSATSGNIQEEYVKGLISNALHLIVQVSRMQDGSRRITHVTEVSPGASRGMISLQDIFTFTRTGIGLDGHVTGVFRGAGTIPTRCKALLESFGVHLRLEMFSEEKEI